MLTHQNWNYDSYDYYCFKSVPSRAKEYCWPVQCLNSICKPASVVQLLDSAIHRMNHRPADKYYGNHIALSTQLISVAWDRSDKSMVVVLRVQRRLRVV